MAVVLAAAVVANIYTMKAAVAVVDAYFLVLAEMVDIVML